MELDPLKRIQSPSFTSCSRYFTISSRSKNSTTGISFTARTPSARHLLAECHNEIHPGICRVFTDLPVVGQIIFSELLHIRKDSDVALSGESLKYIERRFHGCRACIIGIVHHREASVRIDLLAVFEAVER